MVVVLLLFYMARSYNNFLDREEEKFYKQQKLERKRQKLMNEVDGEAE